MKSGICSLLTGLALVATARAGLDVNSGSLLIRGGKIKTESLQVISGASLLGNGTIEASAVSLNGTTAPCGEYPAETGTLLFPGPVELNGVYDCTAGGNEDLDLLSSFAAITGVCAVQMQTNAGAVPLAQPILSGSAASDYSFMGLVSEQAPLFQLSEGGSKNLLVTDLKGDTNANGIPDWWEVLYFGGRTNGVATADADGDEAVNLQEYGAGTDPTNSASCFEIAEFNLITSGAATVIQWNSVTGKNYAVQVSTNILTASFVPLATNLPATPPSNFWTNTVPEAEAQYYRIAVEP